MRTMNGATYLKGRSLLLLTADLCFCKPMTRHFLLFAKPQTNALNCNIVLYIRCRFREDNVIYTTQVLLNSAPTLFCVSDVDFERIM